MQNSQALNFKEMETIVGGYGQGDCLATIAGTAATGVKGGATAGAIATTGPFAGVGALAGAVSGGTLGITAGGLACLVGFALGGE